MFSLKRKTRKTSRTSSSRPVTRARTVAVARAVTHERWIPVRDLELGMHVVELNVPWEDTSFMFQGFKVDSMQLLKQVINSCDEVLVRSEKVANISSSATTRLCAATR